ncbi:MAG: UDP-N-acetylmuramate--L-alanine ligase [Clostridia bacterium]|nr:UDP-N-acetylmuramate--L-alanine ligase [Clostridia bacterium]
MLGIGGVSMSGIAEILHSWGFKVTGSDANASVTTDKLINSGIKVTIGRDFENLRNADAVVYTAAIKKDDPEMVEAKNNNIPIIERSDFLGELTKAFSDTIGISGTHGKTTTTSMVSVCFLKANKDPNIQVGGILKQIDGNYRIGNSDYFIIEACEYVESFLKFRPKAEIILNIDNDHLDYFKTFENIKNAFIKYVKLLPEDGFLVLNADDKNCLDLASYTKSSYSTYGINNKEANFIADNITFNDDGFSEFDVYKNKEFFEHIQLSVAGLHNVLNALACISLCDHYGISSKDMKDALLEFTGAGRRLEYKGSYNNIRIYDDYAHHPTEIKATCNALNKKKFNESWVIFQPHTYSRTKNLLDDFVRALSNFDHIILADIYAARETNTYGVSSKDIADRINSTRSSNSCEYISNFKDIVSYIKEHAKPNDVILTLGAGNVTDIGPMILE